MGGERGTVRSSLYASTVTGTSALRMTGCPLKTGGALVVTAIDLDMAKLSACETRFMVARMRGC